MKAISPMIAVVLLIAFTVAVGGILSVWLNTLSQTQTATVSSATDKQVKCSSVNLVVKDVRVNVTGINGGQLVSGKYANVTIKYESGTATLTPNVTIEVFWRGERNSTTSTTDLTPGESHVVSVNVSRTFANGTVAGGLLSAPEIVRARTWCETDVPIIAECKASEPCIALIT